MGFYAELQIFCRNYDLDPHNLRNQELYIASCKHSLSHDQVCDLIQRGSWSPCLECGTGMKSGLRRGKWQTHCFYCGLTEETDEPVDPVMAEIEKNIDQDRKRRDVADAIRLWAEAIGINNTPVVNYLRSRGLDPPPDSDGVLRWHP